MSEDRQHYTEPITPGCPPDGRGIRCPRCGCRHFRTVYTRAAPGESTRRRKQCRHCGRRLTTWERASL